MILRPARLVAVGLATLLLAVVAGAQQLTLPSVFGDHMVLQRGGPVPWWGTAAPGAEVRLEGGWWEGALTTNAGEDGRWRLESTAPAAGGPYTIEVRSGTDTRRFEDVLLGEVWLCGGQSNMEWTLGPRVGPGIQGWEAELEDADYPQIRLFDVPHRIAASPQDDVDAQWTLCTPDSARVFSAIGFLTGRRLHHELDVPVGLISCNWGGTVAEAWTSRATLEDFGAFDDGLAQVGAWSGDDARAKEKLRAAQTAWWDGLAEQDPGSGEAAWYAVQPREAGPWQTVTLPGAWESSPLGDVDGIVWYRRTIELDEGWVGEDLTVHLGPIDDYDTTWVNGEIVGFMHEPGNWQTPRAYEIPGELVTSRTLTLAVRVLDTGGAGGLVGNEDALTLTRSGTRQGMPLAGSWMARRGAPLDAVGQPPQRPSLHQNMPTVLHNGMLRPVVPFGIRGVLWYQGESNRTRAYQYRRLFPAMIEDWRRLWGRGDFPFYYVQIAPYAYGGDQGQAAALREAQTLALRLPNTGMAVTMDVGNPRDIHPRNKQAVADRLARWALAKTYGRDEVVYSGPLLAGYRVEGDRVRLWFDHAHGGLATRDGAPPSHFTIAGKDRIFQPAQASIEQTDDGWSVVVHSQAVAEPHAVRYAWGAADEPNLVNGAGLVAPSFRTDAWPAWPGGPVR